MRRPAASREANQKPALCRSLSCFLPGFPRPAISFRECMDEKGRGGRRALSRNGNRRYFLSPLSPLSPLSAFLPLAPLPPFSSAVGAPASGAFCLRVGPPAAAGTASPAGAQDPPAP